MRTPLKQLMGVVLVATAVVSCDTRLPTTAKVAKPGDNPVALIDSPTVNTQVNIGDSIFVRVQLQAGNTLKSVSLSVDAVTGDIDLGTFALTPRYSTAKVDFKPGITDTTIRRYLKPLNPADQTLDSLVIIAIVTDTAGLVDTNTVRAALVSGPHVTIEAPAANDSIPFGVGVAITAHAIDPDGIARISIRVQGDPTWPTKLDTTMVQTYNGSTLDQLFTAVANIPANAPGRSKLTVTATSVDGNRQPGSASPIALFIRSAASIAAPRVTQVVPARSERTDTVEVTATGQGITDVGLIVSDSAGTVVDSFTVPMPLPLTSNVHTGIALRLPITKQGQHLAITAFALDQVRRIGYAVRSGQSASETIRANAVADSTQIVYGQTYTMPFQGTVGDIAVDVSRGNVFLTNTTHNRLEVWQNAAKNFDATGVAVGSLPWGMTVAATNPDTLLVANSGGTNISRVFIGSSSVPALHEDLPNRILTRNIYVYTVTESKDATTGKITLTATGPLSYSDRPQYIAQASTGRIYFSTRPTSAASTGTIRWLDPSFPSPDPRLIWQYAPITNGTNATYVLFNVDSLKIALAPVNSSVSDTLYVWDHPYGQKTGVLFSKSPSVAQVTANMAAAGSDIETVLRLDIGALALSDTTFVASSVNRHWIAFGEGNTSGAGRLMMTADSAGVIPQFFSPLVTVSDLTDNAAEKVFGVALDKTGKTLASHGLQSYFSTVDDPFHLRLQGKYDSFDNGAGIALHPDADGQNSPSNQRLSFVASQGGEIEIVDIAYFINRGRLTLKYPIYGPLRVSQPMAGDAAQGIVLKLFALTSRGLIVIDLTANDIKAGPP